MPPQVTVLYSGFEIGIEVQSGGTLSTCASEDSPCRRAFEDYEGELCYTAELHGACATFSSRRAHDVAPIALPGPTIDNAHATSTQHVRP